jgi:transcriptional regulator with XRE-family HTH domain
VGETFGQYVARKREAAGLTQVELAGRVGVTPTYIGYLEREVDPTGIGERLRPMIEVVDAVAAALGLPLTEVRLAAGHDPPAGTASSSFEVVRINPDEGDFAALRRKYESLTPEQRRSFRPVLEMVDRELDRLLKQRRRQRVG